MLARCWPFALPVLALAASSALALTPEPQVVALDEPALFLETIGHDVGAVVEWYAPWCRWCKKFKKDYSRLPARVADAARKDGASPDEAAVIIAAVNVEANSDLAHKYNVEGLPTIQWIPPGAGADPSQAVLYNQKRTLKKLVPWVREQQKATPNLDAAMLGALGEARGTDNPASASALVLTSETFEEVTQDPKKNVLVALDADWCEHSQSLRPTLDRLAHIFSPEDNCLVARINAEDNLDVTKQYGVENLPKLILFPAALPGTTDKFARQYNADQDEGTLVEAMNKVCQTHRLSPSGWLDGEAGRLEALDKLVGRLAAAVGHGRAYADEAATQAQHARHWITTMRGHATDVQWSEEKEASARVYERVIAALEKQAHDGAGAGGRDWLGDELDALESRLFGAASAQEANTNYAQAPRLARAERDALTVQANILRGILDYRTEIMALPAHGAASASASASASEAGGHEDL